MLLGLALRLRDELTCGDTLGLLDAEPFPEPLAERLRHALDRSQPLNAQRAKLPHDAADRLLDALGHALRPGLALGRTFAPCLVFFFFPLSSITAR